MSSDDPAADVNEEDVTEGLDEVDEELVEAMNASQEGRLVDGPEDLEGESGRYFEDVVPTGELHQEGPHKGEHKLVQFEARVPDMALELVQDYMENIGKPGNELKLWDHFDVSPEWLLDEKRHGLFRDDNGNLFARKDGQGSFTDEYLQAFDEEERREHDKIVFSDGMKRRITLKLLDKSPADGDFFAEQLGMVPSDVIKSAGRLHSESQQNSESDPDGSKGGAPGSGQSSPDTSTGGDSSSASKTAKTPPGPQQRHGTIQD